MIVERQCKASRKHLRTLMRNPGEIGDARLRLEVERCCEIDAEYSPYFDRVRRTIGLEYEYILHQKLRCRGVPFETEDDLRERGAAKTPDVYLPVPLAIQVPSRVGLGASAAFAGAEGGGRGAGAGTMGEGYRLIHWIDSKAMFGDDESHKVSVPREEGALGLARTRQDALRRAR